MSRIVVVGGGFGGLHAFRVLVKAGHRVTLIDRNPYTTFQPLLYQVATGGLNPGDITYSLRRYVSTRPGGRGTFRRATVTGIDLDAKAVVVSRGDPVPYDQLILAQGVGANFFGIPGASENARTIYTRAAALQVRDLIFSGLEHLTASKDPDRRFTVAVVGGGATGVEMAGTLAEMKSEALPVVYPELQQDNFRVVLVEMADTVLAPFAERLQHYTIHQLKKRGVDVRLGTAVKEVRPDALEFADGGRLETDVVIWASGVGAHPVVAQWGVPQGRGGRILIGGDLRVQGFEDIYAVGDCALDPDNPQPQLAQPAIQMGEYAARHIIARSAGQDLPPFAYADKGTMATIGRNAAVAQIPPGLALTGFPAWSLWVGVHLVALLGGRNRLQTMINMLFRYVSWPKSAAGIIGDVAEVPR